jgi:hypothetical protein
MALGRFNRDCTNTCFATIEEEDTVFSFLWILLGRLEVKNGHDNKKCFTNNTSKISRTK